MEQLWMKIPFTSQTLTHNFLKKAQTKTKNKPGTSTSSVSRCTVSGVFEPLSPVATNTNTKHKKISH